MHRLVPLKVNINNCRYQTLVGVGGIGSGSFFALRGNHTLGREESRGARFLDRRDYCKLHIICHYVQSLLGPEFPTIPIGQVGNDDVGERLLSEMEDVGLEMRHVKVSPEDQTLFSFCFVYPDGSGGNMTTDDSACAKVDAAFVTQAEAEFGRYAGRGVALAAPEVPMEARQRLLELGTEFGFWRVASFVAEEINPARQMGMLEQIDLLALNADEAAAAAGISPEEEQDSISEIVEAAVERLRGINPRLLVSTTAGKNGSWSWDGSKLVHVPALAVDVVSTAGAGDAHLAGILAGMAAGLTLPQAQELGTLVAAHSVTSPHTIDKRIDREALRAFAEEREAPISDPVRGLLRG
jgi:sugar/nucleoside kinase (ribokinase family)